MKFKEKNILLLMVLFFVLSTIMFCYQNVYKTKKADGNMISVLVARNNIDKNSKINEKNTKWIKIPQNIAKDIITESNILKADDIPESKVSKEILKGQFILKEMFENNIKNDTPINTYTIDLIPDFSSKLKTGDLIKVYVQVIKKDGEENKTNNLLVFDKKEILGITGGNETDEKENKIKVEVTDKEALSYYNAKQIGKIIVLKYENDVNKTDCSIPIIGIQN